MIIRTTIRRVWRLCAEDLKSSIERRTTTTRRLQSQLQLLFANCDRPRWALNNQRQRPFVAHRRSSVSQNGQMRWRWRWSKKPTVGDSWECSRNYAKTIPWGGGWGSQESSHVGEEFQKFNEMDRRGGVKTLPGMKKKKRLTEWHSF